MTNSRQPGGQSPTERILFPLDSYDIRIACKGDAIRGRSGIGMLQ